LITASHPSFWNNEKVPDPAAAATSATAAMAPLATTDPAMVRVDALVPVERMQSFKTNIAFMKSPGKLLNITRQMTTIDHPDSILKICFPDMETPLLRIHTFSVYDGINSYLKRKKKDKL
jgi:hypothetical protein